jgi:hypothetical protein
VTDPGAPVEAAPPPPPDRGQHPYRGRRGGLFIPVLLMVVGTIALLANLGLLNTAATDRLIQLWPLALVLIGVLVIVSRTMSRGPATVVSVLVTVLLVGGAATYATLGADIGQRTTDFSGPVGELSSARLVLDHGGAEVTVKGSSDLGSALYRAHIVNPGLAATPTVSLQGNSLDVNVPDTGFLLFGNGAREVDITLSSRVSWGIDLHGGASSGTLDLSQLRLTDMTIEGGASDITATLAPPGQNVTITVSGGASNLRFHAPPGAAVRIDVNGGASSLHADGHDYNELGGSVSYTSPGYGASSSRYTITVNGGASDVTLDRSG